MPFINSTNILVYPSAYRGYTTSSPTTQYNPEAKLNSEYNITTLNYKIAKRSFVITPSFSAGGSLEFSIYGYYFKIKALAAASIPTLAGDSNATQLWAGIKVKALNTGSDAGNTSYPGYSLVNCDNEQTPLDTNDGTEDKFGGVLFNKDSNFSTTVTDKVCLLVKSGSTWVIPAYSKLKVILSDIKGGTLDGVEKGLDEYLSTGRIDAANVNVSSTIVNEGTTTLKGDTEVGTSSVNKTLKVHGQLKLQNGSTDKFTVDSSGNVVAKGTASIDGNTAVKGTFTVGTSSAKKATTLNGTLSVTGDSSISSTTESSGTTSGALKVSGGVGIAKKLNVGGDAAIGGVLTVSGSNPSTFNGPILVKSGGVWSEQGIDSYFGGPIRAYNFDNTSCIFEVSTNAVDTQLPIISTQSIQAGDKLQSDTGELHLKNRVTNSSSYTVLKSGTQNTAREIVLPNASGTVALKDINNEFSAKQDFNAGLKLKSDQTFEIGGTTYTISGSGDSKFKDIDFTGTLKVNGSSTYSIGNTGNATLNQVYAKGGLFVDDGSTKKNINNVFGASLSGSGTDTIQLLDKTNTAIGSSAKIDYTEHLGHNNGYTVGNSTTPIYFSNGVPVTSAATVGSATKPIYLNSGVFTQSTSTVGSSNQPVYLSSGTITAGTPYASNMSYLTRSDSPETIAWTNGQASGRYNEVSYTKTNCPNMYVVSFRVGMMFVISISCLTSITTDDTWFRFNVFNIIKKQFSNIDDIKSVYVYSITVSPIRDTNYGYATQFITARDTRTAYISTDDYNDGNNGFNAVIYVQGSQYN